MSFRTPSRVKGILQAAAGLRDYTHEAQRLAELTEIASRVLPAAIRPAVRAGRLRTGVLILLAENTAVAAKLKQFAPRLLASYRKSGSQVTEIRVAVQVAPKPPRASPLKPKLSSGTISEISDLATRVTDPGLREALERLAGQGAALDPAHGQAAPKPPRGRET